MSGNLGEFSNSFSIEIVSHRKVLELQYALHIETLGTIQPTLQGGRKKVGNNHLLCQNKQNDDTLEAMTNN